MIIRVNQLKWEIPVQDGMICVFRKLEVDLDITLEKLYFGEPK